MIAEIPASQAFEDYYHELISILPMNNPTFIKCLEHQAIFVGDQKALTLSKETTTYQASYFLHEVIRNDMDMNFEKLLNVMEEYGGSTAKLAAEIKTKMGLSADSIRVPSGMQFTP